MRFAFSSNAFARHPLADAIAAVAALGYAGIEIMADRPHAWPPACGPREIREIRATLQRHRLAVTNLNAFTMHAVGDTWHPSWIDPDPVRRQDRIEHTRRCLRLAEALGVPSISTEPGGPPLSGMTREEALRLFREGLDAVEPVSRATGVKVLIEPEPGLLIATGEEFAAFCADLSPEVFGLNFDAGHFFCVGEDPAEAVVRFLPVVGHVHLEDIDASREHRHLIPGTGSLPLAAFLRALESGSYQGFVTVELYPYQERPVAAAAQAMAHLRRLTARSRDSRHAEHGSG